MELVLDITVIFAHIMTVFFAAKTHRWAWLFSLLSCGIMAYFFLRDHLFVSSIYNAYGAVMAIIGFCSWKRVAEENEKSIRWSNPVWTILTLAALTAIIFTIDKNISHKPFTDSICTSMNIIATFLLVRKDINAWLLWIVTDTLYIIMGITDGSIRYILIYGVMLGLAIFALINYIRSWKNFHKSSPVKG